MKRQLLIPNTSLTHLSCLAATESERGESVHGECGQEAGDHGPADQVAALSQHSFLSADPPG